MAAKATTSSRDVTAELAFLTRALKAPTLRRRSAGMPNVPVARPGAMKSSWWRVCSVKYLPENPMAVKDASERPASRRGNHWRSSTSTTPEVSNVT